MKKLALFLALVSVSAVSQAQKSAIFKHTILPNHNYQFTRNDGFNLDVITKDTTTKKDTATGNPVKKVQLKSTMESGSLIKTAAENTAQQIPVSLTCTKSATKATFNGDVYPTPESNPGEGESLDGWIDHQFKVHVDTTTANAAVKAGVQSAIADIPTTIKFPDAAMKVGDSFMQEESITNLDIPGFDKDKEYMMKVTYKLTAIKNNLAYFDTSSAFDMEVSKDMHEHHMTLKSNGSGTGKMVYDIAKSFPKSITRDFTMMVDINSELMKLAIKVNMSRDEKIAINAN